jgi:hypothetical protein
MTRARYAFADLTVDSALPLPELSPAPAAAPVCRIDMAPPPPAIEADARRESRPVIAMLEGGRGYQIDFPGVARFEVDAEGGAVVCAPVAGLPDPTIRHLLLDQILPRVLFLRGALVLHASVLRSPDGRAIAFLGASGAGKSTLAAGLVAAGWSFLSDDVLVIQKRDGRPAAIPTYPELRLWPDVVSRFAANADTRPVAHTTDKVRVVASSLGDQRAFSPSAAPLGRIYFVKPEDGATLPAVERVRAADALRNAFEAEFRLSLADRPSLQASFDRITGSGVLPLCRRLSYPRVFEALPALRAEIQRDLVEP